MSLILLSECEPVSFSGVTAGVVLTISVGIATLAVSVLVWRKTA